MLIANYSDSLNGVSSEYRSMGLCWRCLKYSQCLTSRLLTKKKGSLKLSVDCLKLIFAFCLVLHLHLKWMRLQRMGDACVSDTPNLDRTNPSGCKEKVEDALSGCGHTPFLLVIPSAHARDSTRAVTGMSKSSKTKTRYLLKRPRSGHS